jgi:hypothetical protein
VREQDLRRREVEDGDGCAEDGDVTPSDEAVVVRVPDDEQGKKRTEQRREEGEQQED